MDNAVRKIELVNYPAQLGAFVYEDRAPKSYEVKIYAEAIERAVAEGELAPADNNFVHEVCDGFYWRSLFLPRGAHAVGKVHRKAHIFYVKEGAVSIYSTMDGVKHMKAGEYFFMSAMSQKVAIASEDSIVMTCEPTTKFTPEEAAEELHVE